MKTATRLPTYALWLLIFSLLFSLAPWGYAQSTRPGMGSIPYGSGVTFRVWAPNATNVTVRGDFNGWGNTTLTSEGNGNWSADVPSAQVGQQYKYRINNSFDKRDPRARRVTNSSGNSIIYDPHAFNWGGTAIPMPWRNDLAIYQMHVGTLEGGNPPRTFDHAITRLDHIQNLGINVIKLMPVNEFPGGRSWGYNPSDLLAIESDYGSADALKRFVRACHERGISIFMDVVHNHYGPTDLDLWRFDGWFQNNLGGIYFYNDNRAHTPWGSTRPDFGRPEVRSFIRDQIIMFINEYRVGGFRWDSVYNIINTDQGANTQGRQMLTDINWELLQNYPHVVRGSEDHAFDFSMNFENQWDVGYRWDLHGQIVPASDANRNMNTVAGLLGNWAGHHRVVFTEAHDYIARNHSRSRIPSEIDSGNPDSIWARKRALLGAGIVMTTPGIPMIFQGQEFHETLAFHDDTALRWTRTNTFAGIVRAYTDLIHSRRNLRGGMQGLKGTGINVHHINNTAKVISYVRWDAGGQADDVVVVANFSSALFTNNNYMIQFPSAGTWYSHFNSDAQVYSSDFGNIGPSQVSAAGTPPTAAVNMGMYSIQIFSKQPIGDPPPPPPPPVPSSVAFSPTNPVGCGPITITYDTGTAGPLYGASQVYIHIGRNGWQNIITPNPAMSSLGSNKWQYVYSPAPDTYELNMVFNNGAGVWDNNNQQDWALAVTDCFSDPMPFKVVFITPEHTIESGNVSDLITIQLQDEDSQAAAGNGATMISLHSNRDGAFRNAANTANITNVTIADGQDSASFRYTSLDVGQHLLTASHATLADGSQNLTVTAPPLNNDVRVLGNGVEIADGSASPGPADHTDFGDVYVGEFVSRTYTITNSGTESLGLGSVTVDGMHASEFVVVSQPPAALASGQATTFAVEFHPAEIGLRSATLSFTNTVPEKSPYNFSIQGMGAAPGIAVTPDTLAPSVTLGGTPANDSFSVTNIGTGVLNYDIATNQGWLAVSPSFGSLETGDGQIHTVVYLMSGLGVGVHNATITITGAHATNSPQTISVSLTIEEPAPADRLAFSTPVRTILEGETSLPITVELRDAANETTASDGITVINLSSDRPGTFRNENDTADITSVTISNGQFSASFRYTSMTAGTHLLTAEDDAGVLESATQSLTVSSQVTEIFHATGEFLVPNGVTELTVELWGGGGGARQSGTTRRAGGGGGAYARATVAVIAGQSYAVVVGQGGAAGDPGGTGGDSLFGDGSQVLAKGGGGALANNNPGPGGSAALSVSSDGIRFAGGAGGARGPTNGGGGGGGGSAFTNANGVVGGAGTVSAGGAGGAGTGAGGAGGAPVNPGQTGLVPGGGGGGNGNGSSVSGAGANGRVVISYVIQKVGMVSFDPAEPDGCVDVTITYDPAESPLQNATNVVMLLGRNGWQDIMDVAMVEQGDGTWTATVAIAVGTFELNLAFNNGEGIWDNNADRDWSLAVNGCVFPPGMVTVNPEFPQGCIPVTITYDAAGGVLTNVQQMYIDMGHNNWLNPISRPMTNVSGDIWTFTYAIPQGTWQLDFAIRDGEGTWDNNNGNDWQIFVTGCLGTDGMGLSITNPSSDISISYTEDSFTISGTALNMEDDLYWENTLTGESGYIPADSEWNVATVALDVGPNLFRISGMNSTDNPNHGARDSATNEVYTSAGNWISGQNGGQRWGNGWTLSATINAGHFLADTLITTNQTISSKAWGLWANSAGLSEAIRPFADRLRVGDVFTFRLQNKFIDGGSTIGVSIKNGFGENLFEFFFIGGGLNYLINDSETGRDTGVPWTSNGMDLAFELTTPTTYRFNVNGNEFTGELATTAEMIARRVRVWNDSAGGGENHNLYLADLAINGLPLESLEHSAERTIHRKYGPHFTVSTENDPRQWKLTFPLTEFGQIYEVYYNTNLVDGAWIPLGYDWHGDGFPLQIILTNNLDALSLRTGMRPVE